MKAYISLDSKGYDKKPLKEIGSIKRRVSSGWQEIALETLADRMGNKGYAAVPGRMVDGISAQNCKAMQIFMLDFDHGIGFDEIKCRCDRKGIPIAFAYQTYSSSEKEEKFRIAFVCEHLVEDTFIIKIIIAMLHKIFPECDAACKNVDRMYFGGKKLIFLDKNAHFALVQLLFPFYEALDTGNNFKRNSTNFCKKHNILMFNDRPVMGERSIVEPILLKYDENWDSLIIHTIGEHTNSSFFIVESDKLHPSIKCRQKQKCINCKESYGCQLLNDFNSGEKLEHMQRFAIMTNLMAIKGGIKHFFEVLNRYYSQEVEEKWVKSLNYMKGYLPQRCSERFCPYYEKCENAGTIVATLALDRKIYREKETYYSIEQANRKMVDNLYEAFECSGDGIHLISAQTGLGKTKSYIDLIVDNPEQKFIVAVPTIRLKEEVAKRLFSAGLYKDEIFITKSVQGNCFFPLSMQKRISEAHNQGIHNITGKVVKEYYNTIKEDRGKAAVAEECLQILDGIKAVKNERVIVTTHAFFMNIDTDFLKGYTIVIDEDILQLHILNRTASVSVSCLERLKKTDNPTYSAIASQMLVAKENKYQKIQPYSFVNPLSEEQIGELECTPDDNVNDIPFAGSFVKLCDNRTGEMVVKYFCPIKLPKAKYIIMSATLNYLIYQKYFGDTMKVYQYHEWKAEYEGELVQYTYHSLGRRDLFNKEAVFSFARNIAGADDLEIITFKKYDASEERKKLNSAELHYGNAIGVNNLSGKTLGIIGTPFKVPEAYKLIACFLGADVNQKIDERPKVRRVEYKNRSFLITTYGEPLLREIQLYAIESELEQCIGRARLLRNNCKVYLFSCFPCEQAKIHIQNYLV